MYQKLALVFGGVLAAAGCAQTTHVESAGEVAPAMPVTRNYVPAGTAMNIRLNQSLGTRSSREGDAFTATVIDPVIAQDGSVAVPAGATLSGHVTGLHTSNIPGEQSIIRLNFDDITLRNRTYPFGASISNVTVQNQPTNAPANPTRGAVTGAAAGAVLGAIVSGGELSKILTGGLLGAAAGTVISMGQGGTQSVIPAGSMMTIRSSQPVSIR